MKKDPEVFICHILESIDLIEEYSKNATQAQFLKKPSMQDAIIRSLEIIGESVKNLPNSFRDKHPDIPWKKMAGMRDILIHEYFDVDLILAWKVVQHELPKIKTKLQQLVDHY